MLTSFGNQKKNLIKKREKRWLPGWSKIWEKVAHHFLVFAPTLHYPAPIHHPLACRSIGVMSEETIIIKRKPRTGSSVKFLRKMTSTVFSYGIPVVRYGFYILILFLPNVILFLLAIATFTSHPYRYGIIPGLLLVSVYLTEPQPSLVELLNPFF